MTWMPIWTIRKVYISRFMTKIKKYYDYNNESRILYSINYKWKR